MQVKICGIRTPEEAINVGRLHPSAIGIIVGFKRSIAPNNVSEEQARSIVEAVNTLPNPIDTFILTEDQDPETNLRYARSIKPSHLQLTGNITPEDVKKIKEGMPGINIVKVIHIAGSEIIDLARAYENTGVLSALLLDTGTENKTGGTGKTHDWAVSREIIKNSNLPVWLAGGLRVTNLRDAIDQVQSYGVDVETGVQNPDGSKNYGLIREFIQIATEQSTGKEWLMNRCFIF